MMVVAESIKSEGTDVSIVCNESEPEVEDAPGHGVLNGGHTYKVLQHAAPVEGREVSEGRGRGIHHIERWASGFPRRRSGRFSRARNTSEKVPLHALRELAGDWTIVKRTCRRLLGTWLRSSRTIPRRRTRSTTPRTWSAVLPSQ